MGTTMFPGPGAEIYRNSAGEVTGWDYPSYGPPDEPADDEYGRDDEWCRKHRQWNWHCDDEECTADKSECDHPEWVAGFAVVSKEDLETVREARGPGNGPRCKYCDVLYDPEMHGFCAGIYD